MRLSTGETRAGYAAAAPSDQGRRTARAPPHTRAAGPDDRPYAAISRSASSTASSRLSTTGTPTPSRLARLCEPPV